MHYPKITVSVLNMNGKGVLADCLHSIQNVDYPNYDVIVVDNNSSDGSQEFIRNTFPEVSLIENSSNEGVAEGENVGIRAALEAGSDFVFTLNNDTVLDRNVLRELLRVLEQDANIGIAGPALYSMEDPTRLENAGGNLDWSTGRALLLNAGETSERVPEIRDVDYVGLFFADPAVLNGVGLLNKKYFAYWEDTDLCTRVKKAGYRIVCVSTAKVWHKHAYTTRSMGGFCEYHSTRNEFWFWKTHTTRKQWISFILPLLFSSMRQCGFILVRKKNSKGFIASCKGVVDRLLRNPG